MQATPFLFCQQRTGSRSCLTIIVGMAAINSQAATMGGKFFNIPHSQAVGLEDAIYGVQRQIGKMLVIDGVELGVLDQAHQMREFQGNGAAGFQSSFQTPEAGT